MLFTVWFVVGLSSSDAAPARLCCCWRNGTGGVCVWPLGDCNVCQQAAVQASCPCYCRLSAAEQSEVETYFSGRFNLVVPWHNLYWTGGSVYNGVLHHNMPLIKT